MVTMTAARNVTATFTLDRHLLTAATEGSGSGSVLSTPSRITRPDDCSERYDYGPVATLTATAALGSELVRWGRGGQRDHLGHGDKVVTAAFDLTQSIIYLPMRAVDSSGAVWYDPTQASEVCRDGCRKGLAQLRHERRAFRSSFNPP